MKRAYIFGAGGHAHVIASFLDADPVFLVENDPKDGSEMQQARFWSEVADRVDGPVYIGIGNNEARARVFSALLERSITPATCIAPTAWIAKTATIGPGAVICAGAVVGTRARLGANTIVNTLSSVDHDCELGDHTQVTVGVTIAGTVTIGTNGFLGAKSAIIPNVTLGNNVKVMAGAVVTKSFGNDVMLGGIPARIMD
jgi:UDP-perosamine 4-acetyltransferase